jgi:hypothetical protein
MEIRMRRAIAASVAVTMMTVGGGASYALFGRHASYKQMSSSAMDAPRVETARMLTTPIAPPEPDLIAAKLAPQPILWPDAPKPVVKAKRPDAAGTVAKTDTKAGPANPAGPKSLGAKSPGKSAHASQAKPKPNPKKQASANAAIAN